MCHQTFIDIDNIVGLVEFLGIILLYVLSILGIRLCVTRPSLSSDSAGEAKFNFQSFFAIVIFIITLLMV